MWVSTISIYLNNLFALISPHTIRSQFSTNYLRYHSAKCCYVGHRCSILRQCCISWCLPTFCYAMSLRRMLYYNCLNWFTIFSLQKLFGEFKTANGQHSRQKAWLEVRAKAVVLGLCKPDVPIPQFKKNCFNNTVQKTRGKCFSTNDMTAICLSIRT